MCATEHLEHLTVGHLCADSTISPPRAPSPTAVWPEGLRLCLGVNPGSPGAQGGVRALLSPLVTSLLAGFMMSLA